MLLATFPELAHELARITLESRGIKESSHADGRKSGLLLGNARFIDDLFLIQNCTTNELAGCLDVFTIAQASLSVHASPVRT